MIHPTHHSRQPSKERQKPSQDAPGAYAPRKVTHDQAAQAHAGKPSQLHGREDAIMFPIDSSCQQLGQVSRWNGEGNETAIDGQHRADSLVAKGLSYRGGGCVPWFAVPLGGERDPGEQPHPQKSGEDIRHEGSP